MIVQLLLLLLALILLAKSATWLVSSLTQIARILRLSEFTVGFILMALATSLPELFVSLIAVTSKSPSLALGNILGSNIADLTIVIGLTALLARGIRVRRVTKNKDVFLMALTALLPLILLYDLILSRADGILLLAAYALYAARLFLQKEGGPALKGHRGKAWRPLALFAVGVVLLLLSAKVLVSSAIFLADLFHLPIILIGLTVVALGTSLPEIFFETRAILSQHRGMVFGDLFGAVVTNSSLILGLCAIITPIKVIDLPAVLTSALFLTLTIAVFTVFIRSRSRLSWGEGIGLIFLYIAYIAALTIRLPLQKLL